MNARNVERCADLVEVENLRPWSLSRKAGRGEPEFCPHSDRPAESLPKLDEVAGADAAVAVEGEEITAEGLAEDDEVAGGNGAVAVLTSP